MDGNRKKPDGRLQFQKERFFSRFCALQVLFQQDFQPESNGTRGVGHIICA